MKTKIHVNQHIIRSNRKKGLNEPVFTVKQGKNNRYAAGPSRGRTHGDPGLAPVLLSGGGKRGHRDR